MVMKKKKWAIVAVVLMVGTMGVWAEEEEREMNPKDVIRFLREYIPQAADELRELKREDPTYHG